MRFLNAIKAEVPAGKMVQVILDNYAAHKHPKVRAWLDRHERFVFHFTPTSCSWLNAVKGFFAKLSRRRLKRGVFRSVVDLQAAINRKSGLDEALGLAIGLGSVGPGEDRRRRRRLQAARNVFDRWHDPLSVITRSMRMPSLAK